MKFLQRTPFLRLLFPVVVGVLLYNYCKLPAWSLVAVFCLSVVLVVLSWVIRPTPLQYKFRWLFGSGVSAFFMVFSYVLCVQAEKNNEFEHLGEEGIFLVELIKPPIEKERSYQCEVKILQFTDSTTSYRSRGKGYVYFQKDERAQALSFGDIVLIETNFAPPTSLQNPGGFNYADYLKRKGICATAYVPAGQWKQAGRNEAHTVTALAQQCRSHFLNVFRRFNFPQDNFAVLSALSFGYTDELTSDLRSGYSTSGITHILAVSGLHVGIIYVILTFLLGFLNQSTFQRCLKATLILLFLWSYAFITGLPPSAFRATLMFTFVAVGTLFDRKAYIYNTLFMSAFFMLLINPNLLFQVSFQLSYSAVLGIVYFQPKIAGLLNFKYRLSRWVWNLLTVSISAQLGTMPFTLYYFQSFPNYFLLTNLIAIPATSVILYLAVCLLITAPIPFVSGIVAFLLNSFLSLLNRSVELVQQLPHPISTITPNVPQVLLMILIIFFLAYYIHSRKYYSLICGLSCILLFFLINIFIQYQTAHSEKLIVYSAYRHTHINFISGSKNYIHTSDSSDLSRTASNYWHSRKIDEPTILDSEKELIRFGNQKIFILKDNFCHEYTSRKPLSVDYLIIGHSVKPQAKELLECFRPKHIITDNTITPWYTQQLQTYCAENDIAFHSTRQDGAFVLENEIDKNKLITNQTTQHAL